MNICAFTRITINHGIKGGMEIHGKILSEGLVEKGHNVTIITTRHPNGFEHEEEKGVNIYYLRDTAPGLYSKQWWKESAKKFEELHKKEKFDVIWSQSVGGYYYQRKLKSKYHIPVATILHGTSLDELKSDFNQLSFVKSWIRFIAKTLPKNIFYHFWWGFSLCHNSNAIITVSNELNKAVQREYFINPNKIFTVYNGIDILNFKPSLEKRINVRNKYGIKESEKLLLIVGQLVRQKGVHLAIQALPRILKVFPNVKLMIVGKGPYLEKLKDLAINLKISDNVIFCGFVPNEETSAYYSACDIYLNPTVRMEGFPLVLAEVMSCEKPIIASNIGGIPSAIKNGVDGILIPPGNIEVLVKSITNLLINKDFADKLAKSAKEKAVREFNKEKMVKNTIRVFEKTVKEKNR